MISKSLSILLSLTVFLFPSSWTHTQDAGTIYIHGKVANAEGMVYLVDNGETGDFKTLDESHHLNLNDKGEFEIALSPENQGYYKIGYNQLYLEPGDSIHVRIDLKDPFNSNFSGRGAGKQDYLKSAPLPKAGSYLDGGRTVKQGCSETVDHILSLAREATSVLDSTDGISDKFRELEHARIRADLINSLYMAPSYYVYVHKTEQDSVEAYFEKFKAIMANHIERHATEFADTNFLQLTVYRNILPTILEHPQTNTEAVSRLEDWQIANRIYRALTRGVESNDSVALASIPNDIDRVKSPLYASALKRSLLALTTFKPGEKAVDFEIHDGSGNITHLSDYEGKVIYIDFWATWCVPCIEERPNFQHLGALYHNKDVVFLSLSVDTDHGKWMDFLKSTDQNFTLEGLVDRHSMPAYNVVQIPRYVLIDKRFTLVDLSAPKPSSSDIQQVLDRLTALD
ncbi:Peroxiredoxin [Parapedobacter luteus]|uniref:Peroxiredoxin n=1 Tax=Parapedobacter luteus TaxID=623280 RepID=A0A1T4ZUL9_9SPHI|nr:TlpA disulfide reductase family protein [Parapedobacter luteus]SKB26430.1 Peroxiredoxin [Parapedobacter luteus]